ncbi:MAG: monovalent cation:proton antiporter family protein [Geothermobacteraceae bacterium]
METAFLADLLILLGLALAVAWGCSRLRQSPVVGYLIAGIILGPSGLHLIANEAQVALAAELGVILLLFSIGLEFSPGRLLRFKTLLLRGGTVQTLATGLALFVLLWIAGLSTATAATLAMALTLSSTAVVLKLFQEQGSTDSPHGRASLAILLAQDILVVFFMVLLPVLAGRQTGFAPLEILKALLLLVGLVLFARKGLNPLLKAILATRARELFRICILFIVLGTAWLTHEAGLSLALGAFLAGMALSDSDYAHQVLSDIVPFRDTFLAIFFISVGMLVDIGTLTDNLFLVLGGLILLSLLKTAGASAAALVCGYPARIALLVGLALFQVGEFSFLLLGQAARLELVSLQTYQVTLAIIALSMMITPLVFAHSEKLAARFRTSDRRDSEPSDSQRLQGLSGHVIIAGYGVSGRNLGWLLTQTSIPHLFIEIGGLGLEQGRKAGADILFGDATSPEVLQSAGINRARALVLTINDPAALHRAVRIARDLDSRIPILVRSRYVLEEEHLRKLGATTVVSEEFESSLQLGMTLLLTLGQPEGRVLKLANNLRNLRDKSLDNLEKANLGGFLSVLDTAEIEFWSVPADAGCIGRSLAELDLRKKTGCSLIGLVRDEVLSYQVDAATTLKKGDTLLLFGNQDDLLNATEYLRQPDENMNKSG